MRDYFKTLELILEQGDKCSDRTGVGTISYFAPPQMRFGLTNSHPVMTEKALYWKGVLYELLWFLKGDTNIQWLAQNGVNIWNEWPYEEYLKYARNLEEPDTNLLVEDNNSFELRPLTLPEFLERIKSDDEFAKKWGDLGPVYGAQWTKWDTGQQVVAEKIITGDSCYSRYEKVVVNQIDQIIDQLRNNPNSRRILLNAWNVAQIDQMALPPCHLLCQFKAIELSKDERQIIIEAERKRQKLKKEAVTEDWIAQQNFPVYKLKSQLYMRSADMFLGVPFNIASYATLTRMIAAQVNMIADELIVCLGDAHIYSNHIEQVVEVMQRHNSGSAPKLPKLEINPDIKNIFDYTVDDFELIGYNHLGRIKAEVAV